ADIEERDAYTLRAKHERIGRLVCENAEALRALKGVSTTSYEPPLEMGAGDKALQAILAEVEQ
ncbi:MAG: hypothetical protein Q8O40_08020, partial [Chloroflexota bacterium]|nr:hypothetical protein [Chloroflexota bacterium]